MPEKEPKYTLERFKFYAKVFDTLEAAKIPYGIIGGFGTYFWSGKDRQPSWDMDVALQPHDVGKALDALRNAGLRIDEKHEHWLNQAWSNKDHDAPGYSTDIIHRHSTGLPEGDVKPWWFEQGMDARFLGKERHFAAPEAIALTKALLWSRRAHDTPDAIQVIYNSNRIKPFDWQLFIRELGNDWRLAYSLALFTEVLYGNKSKDALPQDVKAQLHSWFTSTPISGPVRGNYFAYDATPDAGSEYAWATGNVAIEPQGDVVTGVLDDLNNWHTWDEGQSRLVRAARRIVGQGQNFDWDGLIHKLGDNWRLALVAMLSMEILFGERGLNAISSEIRTSLSQRFVTAEPGEEQGTKLFPERAWNTIPDTTA